MCQNRGFYVASGIISTAEYGNAIHTIVFPTVHWGMNADGTVVDGYYPPPGSGRP